MRPRDFKSSSIDSGFTLVELMVALTIGLIILVAVSSLFVSSKQTYTVQDQLARLQENGRFAMQFVMSDIRMAGYYGCLDDVSDKNVFSVVNSSSLTYSVTQSAIEGLDAGSAAWLPSGSPDVPSGISAISDAIVVRYADPNASTDLAARMTSPSDSLTVTSATAFQQGDIVMVADCASANLMQITNTVSGNTLDHATGGADTSKNPPWPGNDPSSADLNKAYDVPAKIMKFSSRRYYIKDRGDGIPALYRDSNGSAAEEMVDGIEMMKVLYGVDTDDPLDGVPNKYVSAANVSAANTKYGWSAVVTIRVGIIARTLDDKQPDVDTTPLDVDGDGVNDLTPNDHYRRRVFQSTIQLRNMI